MGDFSPIPPHVAAEGHICPNPSLIALETSHIDIMVRSCHDGGNMTEDEFLCCLFISSVPMGNNVAHQDHSGGKTLRCQSLLHAGIVLYNQQSFVTCVHTM